MIRGSIGEAEVEDVDGRRLLGCCWDLVASFTSGFFRSFRLFELPT